MLAAAVPTSFAPVEPLVRQLVITTPDMAASVIAQRVGWTGSITWFRDHVRRLRPEHRPLDPADTLAWLPGDAPHCDLWFPPRKIPLEDGSKVLLSVMVITCAHSRFILGQMIPTRHIADLMLGMWELLQQLDGVPRRLIGDTYFGIGRGKRHAEGVGAVTGTLATTLQPWKPYDPESKGIMERRNGFFETPFMPGRHFASPGDFNTQVTDWLGLANAPVVRTTKNRSVDLIAADRAAMSAPPPLAPALGWVNRVRLGRHYYVRTDSSEDCVDPAAIGRFVDVHADLTRVEVCHEGRPVDARDRVWARGMTITDPAHVAAATVLRERFQKPRQGPASGKGLMRGTWSTTTASSACSTASPPALSTYRPTGRWRGGSRSGQSQEQATTALKQLASLAGALKAARITEAAARLADHARDAGWNHEEHLAAVLDWEVTARNASGAHLRIRAAGFGSRKSIGEFDFDAQPAVRQQVAALASGGFLAEARNVVLLGPPGTDITHLATGLGVAAAHHGHRVLFRHRTRVGHPPDRGLPRRPAAPGARTAAALRTDHRR